MLKKTLKRNKGITLIALVVTIIVLLILAGISINMLMGQNGILSKATTAKTQTESTNARDELALAITSLGMDYHINGQGGTFRDYIFSHEAELKKELGSDDVTLNKTENTITYKGKIFTVNEDGSIEAVDGIALTDTKKTLQIVDGTAEEATLTANLINLDGSITWSSNKPSIVTVTGNGTTATIKAVAAGTATITASCSGKSATCEVTVKNVKTATSLTVDSTAEVEEGSTITLTATQNGTEDITWESKDTTKATVTASGENNKVATITGVAKGTVEIVAKTKNLEAKCTLTVKESSVFGQYVEYDVSYTDAYDSSKEYTTTNGWRILKQTKVSDGVYNVDIISTGIPAKLYYYYSDVSSAPWAGTTDQQKDYVKNYYGTAGDNSVIAAAGLLNHFDSIKFKGNSYSDHNLGYYTKITKGSTTYTGEAIDGSVFVAREGAKVRSVMHTDIPGLKGGTNGSSVSSWGDLSSDVFALQKLGYTTGYYWLASPDTGDSDRVYAVYCSGGVNKSCANYYGIRPVVSMTEVQMEKTKTSDGNVLWKIK